MYDIPVRQIMQTTVVTIHPDALVADARQLLEEFRIRRLPVVEEDGVLVGIVTDTDIREAEAAIQTVSPYDPAAEEEWLAVADVMTRELVTIQPEATVGELAATLMTHKIGGVPVVEPDTDNRQHLIGIVSEIDIFRLLADAWTEAQQTQSGHVPN
jgi:acetoin utilization protein AcuB